MTEHAKVVEDSSLGVKRTLRELDINRTYGILRLVPAIPCPWSGRIDG